jgi:glutathione synthase/RimK-type ligase-like ATP-grasp enzyme
MMKMIPMDTSKPPNSFDAASHGGQPQNGIILKVDQHARNRKRFFQEPVCRKSNSSKWGVAAVRTRDARRAPAILPLAGRWKIV